MAPAHTPRFNFLQKKETKLLRTHVRSSQYFISDFPNNSLLLEETKGPAASLPASHTELTLLTGSKARIAPTRPLGPDLL